MTAHIQPAAVLARWSAGSAPDRRLILFPHAGAGGLAGRAMQAHDMEILVHRRPGRESRMADAAPIDVRSVVAEALEALLPVLAADDLPTAVLGHSFGALPAAEFTAAVERSAPGRVGALALSAKETPPAADPQTARLVEDDDALADWVLHLGGTPEELLADPDMRQVILGPLRADLRASIAHSSPPPHLSVPLLLVAGQDDPTAPSESMEGWARATTGEVRRLTVPGGHHGLLDNADALHAQLRMLMSTGDGRR